MSEAKCAAKQNRDRGIQRLKAKVIGSVFPGYAEVGDGSRAGKLHIDISRIRGKLKNLYSPHNNPLGSYKSADSLADR